MENYNLFQPLQSGFCTHHSCSSAIALLADKWLNSINNSNLSGVVFLDLSKAFDRVDHDILLRKLSVYLKNSPALPLFSSFLHDRKQRVFLNGSFSSEKPVSYGVPQGSVLGPVLFCIYINDLPLHITDSSVECHMLADDTTLQTQSTQTLNIQLSLQSALNDVSEWCASNRMVLNPQKSKSMIITTRQKHQLASLSLNLIVDNKAVEQVNEHKLLGVIIDSKMCWQPHIDKLQNRLSKALFLLSKLQSVINQEARQLFYNAHIKAHIDYASIVWDGCSAVLFNKINSQYRRAVKLILPNNSLSTIDKMKAINILPLRHHFLYNKSILMFKSQNCLCPKYLQDMFTPSFSHYTEFKHNLACPRPRLDLFKTSMSYSGASAWNSLPPHLKSMQGSLPAFKKCLFKHFYDCAFDLR